MKTPKFKFMAMSKLIGVIAFTFVFIISVYAMVEMHNTCMYDSLPQLIISSFSFAGVYTCFYLLMANVENIECERTRREIELENMKKSKTINEEDIDKKEIEINNLNQTVSNLMNQTSNGNLF